MAWQYTPYTAPLLVSGLLAAVVGVVTWRRASKPGERAVAATSLAIAVWAATEALAVSSVGLQQKLLFYRPMFLASSLVPFFWFVFTLQYTGKQEWVTRRNLLLLAIVPATYTAVTWANPYAVFEGATMDTTGPYTLLQYTWGTAVWVIVIYASVLIPVASYLLFKKFLASRNVYRKISFTLLVAGVVLWASMLTSLFGVSPFPHVMMLPFTFLFFGAISAIMLYSYRSLKVLPLDRLLAVFGGRFKSLLPLARDVVIQEMPSGVIVLDNNASIVDINPLARRMVGMENERVIGKKLRDVLPLEDIEMDEDSDVRRMLSPDPSEGGDIERAEEEIWVDTLGERRCYSTLVTSLTDGEGNTTGDVMLINDVTRKKKQQQKLEEKNEQLENFANIVSHDLRNPLNVAEGYASMLEEEIDGSDEVREIRKAHRRMEDLIDDVLTLARQRRSVTETGTVDLSNAVTEAWNNVDTNHAELVNDSRRSIQADRGKLLQMLENLFRNCVEHGVRHETNGDDGVTVHVAQHDDGFYVEDDGPGIPPDKRSKVFEQGYTTSDGGTGLGLSIVKNVADNHGWNVDVDEGSQGGARFTVTIPDSTDAGDHALRTQA